MKENKNKVISVLVLTAAIIAMLCAFNAFGSDCNFSVKLSATSYSYSGKVQKPTVTVTDSDGNTVSSSYYTVTYSNKSSKDVGKYTVTVTAKDGAEITGSKSKTYTIKQKDVEDITVSLAYVRVAYTGSKITPDVLAVNGKVQLVEGRDYTVSYTDNKSIGQATVKIEGMNNYTGTVTKTFVIVPTAVSNAKFVSSTKTSLTVSWSTKSNVDGYVIYSYSNGTYTPLYTVEDSSTKKVTFTATSGTNYTLAVGAYVEVNGIKYYGEVGDDFSAYTLVSKYSKTITISRSSNSSSATIKYKKMSGVSGYQIMYATDKNFKTNKKTVTVTSGSTVSKKISSLKTALPIYVKIRAYLDTDDGRIYGAWSSSVTDFKYSGSAYISKVNGSTSAVLTWDKCTYGHGYQIVYSTKSDFSTKTSVWIKDISTVKKTIKNLSSSKTYYFKVRAYYQINGTKYYSSYTTAVSNSFKYVLATYSSQYVSNANRTTNLKVASEAITGTIIYPGETFDFNDIVGPRTAAKGYKKATVFTGTTGTAQELGGGICQVSSTIFNAVLLGNLKITERHQHSQKVTYVPYGRDAAISGSSKNFCWTNNTKYPIKVVMKVSNGTITCTLYSQKKISLGTVKLKVTQSGSTYTLKRYYNGTVNYTTKSKY